MATTLDATIEKMLDKHSRDMAVLGLDNYGYSVRAMELTDKLTKQITTLIQAHTATELRNVLEREELKKYVYDNSLEDTNGCWLWQLSLDKKGYGMCSKTYLGVKYTRTQRLSYAIFREPPSSDLVTDHLCRVRACVNPHHFELVSITENVMRGVGIGPSNLKKTHCSKGHPFTGDNLYTSKDKRNGNDRRQCMECKRRILREIRAKRRVELNPTNNKEGDN